jgi:formamidopyrimidine-DNA glycosylase
MPELPDITIYVEALERRVRGQVLEASRIRGPFLLRTYDPPIEALHGRRVIGIRRLGKRLVFGFEDDYWLLLHLMIAGRLHWKPPRNKLSGKSQLAAFDFAEGTLLLTEAGTKHRASLWVLRGGSALGDHDPGGIDVLAADVDAFSQAVRRGNHTLKRVLTDPRVFDGIGNAYSDEILHRACLSPLALSQKLKAEEMGRLHDAARTVLREWVERLRAETGEGFPERVTAFHPKMAVHGKFEKPCPVCGAPIQRIRYADNETNYCPRCQTGGRILADRSLSRLLKDAWPKHLDDM